MDGSRQGVFYANLYDIKATPRYSMRTLAYHEGIPGHHFQLAIQQQQKDLPFFRRLIPSVAYSEGWALYAERLAWELGFQEDPYDNIGRLQAELFRAVRLVVDTGIHYKRWSREQAIDYMISNTGMADSDVVAEIERYFVMPGQALAYKVGMTKMLELRDLARAELGDQFDIRKFHNVILTNGSVPLDILEDLVRQVHRRRKNFLGNRLGQPRINNEHVNDIAIACIEYHGELAIPWQCGYKLQQADIAAVPFNQLVNRTCGIGTGVTQILQGPRFFQYPLFSFGI